MPFDSGGISRFTVDGNPAEMGSPADVVFAVKNLKLGPQLLP